MREQRREERLRERERERREAEERERTAWEARQREEEKEQKKRHLEAKAETDGQAVTKVSSREDVACDEGVYSRDSEGYVTCHCFIVCYITVVVFLFNVL